MRGGRESAPESPHLFNAYIDDLSAVLESAHSYISSLIDVTVSVVLDTDDTAIPSDSFEDLQLAANILEEFCNCRRLCIPAAKSCDCKKFIHYSNLYMLFTRACGGALVLAMELPPPISLAPDRRPIAVRAEKKSP